MEATLPALQTPSGSDILGLMPVVILASAFVILMVLDLFVPSTKRIWLAACAALAVVASGISVIVGWFDPVTASGDAGSQLKYFGAYSYDRFGLFIDGVLLISALLTIMISPRYLNRRGIHYGEYYSLILAATTGMMLLAGAASLMVIFLAIELLSIALYILSGFARTEERSQEAALKYLLLGGFASGFLLYGMALIYGETGHTQLRDIGLAIHLTGGADPLLIVGVVLLFIGFAFKISAAPFHAWTPDVYQGAPTSVTTFMSVATKVAAFAALIRVFTYALPDLEARWRTMITLVAIFSMVIGNLGALTQKSIKRMLAYSGIAQAGYILIGVAVSAGVGGAADGISGALFYLGAYAVTNLGAFAVITVMAGRGEDLDRYDDLRGLAFRRPYVAAAMSLFLLSLGGFPPTVGFFGKFFVFKAAIASGHAELAIWGIATSAISVFYYLRVALLMYTRPAADQPRYAWSRTALGGATVVGSTAAATLVVGILAFALYGLATSAEASIHLALLSSGGH